MSSTTSTKSDTAPSTVEPKDYGKKVDMTNPAPKDKTPKLNAEIEEAFGRVPTAFGRVDLLIAAVGYLGDKGLAKYLNEIIDTVDKAEADGSVQGRRDAQQAALDAEFFSLKNEEGIKMPDDPREAEISPIEQPESITTSPVSGLDDLAHAQGLDK